LFTIRTNTNSVNSHFIPCNYISGR